MATKARGTAAATAASRQRKNAKTTAPKQRSRKKPAVRDKGALFDPDSPVVITAQELVAAHTTGIEGFCPRCGRLNPCPVARHALEVCRAAGLEVTP